jgi:crotonobetainyl-CoA:carnitine CoA-transferase CaiB-like acyl-CoA transferase
MTKPEAHPPDAQPPEAQPFDGIRILDFTQVFAGPFATYQLALLGADVIKVERKGGEPMRFSPGSKEWADRAMAPTWCAVNANKRNIALDLKDPKSIEIVKRLAAKADIVAENFRPGVMDRLGIGYEALSRINPKLIYCAVTGFGQEGPERNTPSYDGRIQATSGIMSITGHEDSVPTRAGFAVCDALSGMTAAFAMTAALNQRNATGKGQLVDVAMLDATLTFLSPTLCEYTIAGVRQGRFGNQAVSRIPTANLFAVKDGHILLAVNNEGQFLKLLKAIGRDDILGDPARGDRNRLRQRRCRDLGGPPGRSRRARLAYLHAGGGGQPPAIGSPRRDPGSRGTPWADDADRLGLQARPWRRIGEPRPGGSGRTHG